MKLLILFSAQIKVFVTGLFTLDQDIAKFKEHIRDFLVEIKVRRRLKQLTCSLQSNCLHLRNKYFQEYAGEDTSHLFLDQKESELRQAAEEKRKKQMAVPGILNPHEIKEEGMDGE